MHTINITGHHIDVTQAIKDHINEKFHKVSKLTDKITTVNIILLQDNKNQKAEVTVHLPGKELFAAASSENRLFHAIDAMIDKLTRQIAKHKTKQNPGAYKAATVS
ncbi:ribosome-associated translation inhibitor RaiA [Marinomonas sp. TI.3.20]|uniref:ribosome hibernation-promoting factor, HPF/YfiA family n=1 Tax=Marinomonas sp. TI.3.20 TaxID=3121296 RepID=UPI00311D4CC2